MIRFKPDTWLDSALRYLAMAAPDANVYVEIAAPDVRLAFMALLAVAVLLCWKWRRAAAAPALLLTALIVLSTVPWLATSGNGRYFMAMLLCAGPAVAALLVLLPLSRSMRLSGMCLIVAIQGFLVAQRPPWGQWDWAKWRDPPYFGLDTASIPRSAVPMTYVTLTTISYSLIAPLFPPESRWINISNTVGTGRDGDWTPQFLAQAQALTLVAPTIPDKLQPDGQPNAEVVDAMNSLLRPRRLAIDPSARCHLVPAKGIEHVESHVASQQPVAGRAGFWLCPLRYPVDSRPPPEQQIPATTEAAFAAVEAQCPRFFPRGEAFSAPIATGHVRAYQSSDMRIYVLHSGLVLYKFWRALNPVVIGTVDDVLAGKARVDCDHIRGRSGLPWEREI